MHSAEVLVLHRSPLGNLWGSLRPFLCIDQMHFAHSLRFQRPHRVSGDFGLLNTVLMEEFSFFAAEPVFK